MDSSIAKKEIQELHCSKIISSPLNIFSSAPWFLHCILLGLEIWKKTYIYENAKKNLLIGVKENIVVTAYALHAAISSTICMVPWVSLLCCWWCCIINQRLHTLVMMLVHMLSRLYHPYLQWLWTFWLQYMPGSHFLVVVLFTHWVAGCQRLYTWLRHEGFQTTEPLESIWAVLGDLTHDFIGPRLARKVDLLLWSLGPSDYFKIWRHKLEKSNVRFKGSYFWGTTFAEAKRRLLSPITNWVVRFDFKICTHTTWK